MSETVELATILLTDLVGSTRLATSVGPARADELRDEHFEVLREAIRSSGGREFKNTGDGLMVAFSSASAAVGCAALMQQLFERRYRRAEQQLHVRIGLGAGESTVQHGDYFGMPSIEAARLCDKAPGGGILISPTVKMLAGRCENVELESVGELELKGIPDRVEAFAVRWAALEDESADAAGAGRWPLPPVLRSVPPVSYVGRVAERAVVEHARAAVRTGERRVMFVSGEPGIGKTRLAAYAAHGAHAEGFVVCWGACSEELAAPYEPWIDVCAQLVEHAPDELLAEYVQRHGGELSRLGRDLARRMPDLPAPQTSDPETERFLLFSAVTGLVQQVSETVPVCVVLDDLHWGDGQTVALLKHLARTLERGAVQVIVTYRDSELTREHPLSGVLADLRRIDGVERVQLDGLGANEVAEVISAVAGHELDEHGVKLAGEITAETGGNPFFVGEILRHLTESGTLVFDEDAGRWSIDRSKGAGLPESVRDVIDRRIERLGEQAREMLTTAAVIGRSFDVDLLSGLVDVSESGLLDRLEAAVAASILTESTDTVGRFSFAHALINEALYGALGATRKARMHQRVAVALEELCGQDPGERLGELARHWAAATQPAQAEKAIDYARRAGERALQRLVPDEAVRWFTQALELLDGQPDAAPGLRCELLIGLGEAGREAGVSFRRTLLEASRLALESEDTDRLVRAVLANNRGRTSFIVRVDEQRIELLQAALERVGTEEPVTRARLLSLLALELVYDPDYARRCVLSDEALALARGCGDQRALGQVLRDRVYAIWAPGALQERRANVRELLELAGGLEDPVVSYWAHLHDMDVQVEAGHVADAQEALERCHSIAERVGQPTLRWAVAGAAACLAALIESPEEIKIRAEQAVALGTDSRNPDALMIFSGHISHHQWFLGLWDELLQMVAQAVEISPQTPTFHGSLGVFYLEAGRITEARTMLDEARPGLGHLRSDPFKTTAVGYYSLLAAGLHDEAAAAVLSQQLIAPTESVVWNGVGTLGAIDVYRGILSATLGRHADADARLAAGIELNDRIGAAVWATRARLFWAEQLAQRATTADAEHARQLFGQARDAAQALGTPALLERAEIGLARAAATA